LIDRAGRRRHVQQPSDTTIRQQATGSVALDRDNRLVAHAKHPVPMDRHPRPFSMTLAFADPDASGGPPVRRRASNAPASAQSGPDVDRPTAVVVAALLWLLLGCSGLLWVIAFTRDTDSLVLALAVWVLGFVGPSLCATSLAYRVDGDAPDADSGSIR
jgi:hypothetical protein